MKTYRLGSSPAIHAPGMVAWAINGAAFKKDRAKMVQIIAQGWNLPEDAARELVTKRVPYTIEGETVVFSVGAICQWFARCDNPATTALPHPTLGSVPCCQRCADKVARIEGKTR